MRIYVFKMPATLLTDSRSNLTEKPPKNNESYYCLVDINRQLHNICSSVRIAGAPLDVGSPRREENNPELLALFSLSLGNTKVNPDSYKLKEA